MPSVKGRWVRPSRNEPHPSSVKVRNDSGVEIPNGSLVVISSGMGAAYCRVQLADIGSDIAAYNPIWVAKHRLPDGHYGVVLPWKIIANQNTLGLNVGDGVYLGVAGAWAATPDATRPVRLGTVLVAHATLGTILLCPQGISGGASGTDHGFLAGLADDDHLGYLWGLGRLGGQTLNGGLLASEDIIISSTAHATKGDITLNATQVNMDDAATLSIGGGAWTLTHATGAPLASLDDSMFMAFGTTPLGLITYNAGSFRLTTAPLTGVTTSPIQILSGNLSATVGGLSGGNITLATGNTAANGAAPVSSGQVDIASGTATDTSGHGSGLSGAVQLHSGSALGSLGTAAGDTGDVSLYSGDSVSAGAAAGISGDILIYSGSGDTSGNITLTTGAGTTRGDINLNSDTATLTLDTQLSLVTPAIESTAQAVTWTVPAGTATSLLWTISGGSDCLWLDSVANEVETGVNLRLGADVTSSTRGVTWTTANLDPAWTLTDGATGLIFNALSNEFRVSATLFPEADISTVGLASTWYLEPNNATSLRWIDAAFGSYLHVDSVAGEVEMDVDLRLGANITSDTISCIWTLNGNDVDALRLVDDLGGAYITLESLTGTEAIHLSPLPPGRAAGSAPPVKPRIETDGIDFSGRLVLVEDFNRTPVAAGGIAADAANKLFCVAGANAVGCTFTSSGGVLVQSGAVLNDVTAVVPHSTAGQSKWQSVLWAANKEVTFKSVVNLNAPAIANGIVEVGLRNLPSATLGTNADDIAIFRYTLGAAATWHFITADGVAPTIDTDTGITDALAVLEIATMVADSAGAGYTEVHGYINGQRISGGLGHAIGNAPGGDWKPFAGVTTSVAGVTHEFTLHKMACSQLY